MIDYLQPSHDDVARCAYFIYLHEGCPQGQELGHWFQAEQQLIAGRQHDAGLKPTTSAPAGDPQAEV
ncbi:MAG: hypothetical protein QOE70_846 [Chthoniobacter sp.]|jgi:hypothetical protein|nr:hypothetical protein [Chthoniobacter sp.]